MSSSLFTWFKTKLSGFTGVIVGGPHCFVANESWTAGSVAESNWQARSVEKDDWTAGSVAKDRACK